MKLYDRSPPDPDPVPRRGPTGCPRDLLRRLAPLSRAKDGSWAALTGCSAASTRASAARRGDLRRSSRRTWCSSAMTTLTVLLAQAQGLGAAFLGRRAGLLSHFEAARSRAGLGHGWSAGGVAGLIVCLQARVSPRQIMRRTPGHGSYTHGARIPRLCGLWGPLSAAWQRAGGARYRPVCMGYPDSNGRNGFSH